ncbi:MAG TPA: ABC transporter permease [Acidimicrobiales bacterium]|jgi:simple sugar transport system permease protein|nr:ABC transporter permease [Acidimicrobiales bacterium]
MGLVSLIDAKTAPRAIAPMKNRRTRVIAIIMGLIGVFTIFAFGLGSESRAHSSLTFNPINLVNAPWRVGSLTVVTRWTDVVLGVVMVAIAAETYLRHPRRGVMARFGSVAVLFLFALLFWAARTPGPSPTSSVNITAILVGSSAAAMVLIFGSLSGVMCERSGVVNIAIEGQFIGGAFLGSMIASTTHDFFFAAIAGMVAGGVIGLVLAFLSLRYRSDQIIVGVVLVTMLSSLSSYLNLQVFTPFPNFNTGILAPNLPIPLLSKIPVLGPVFFNQSGFFYVMIILVAVVSFALFKTRYGLHVRAVGEHPRAAATVGINVIRVRYINVVLGGAIAGLGGVAFMATQGQFQVGYTSGYGYIALAALIFGRWRPSGAVVASIIFGLSVYLSYNLVTYNVPISLYILQMFPYLITIAVVAGLIGRVRAPAADGQPYLRD